MAPTLQSCREFLLELGVYLWCTAVRLVFAQWFYWKKPLPLPPVTDKLLLRSATALAADIRNGKVKSVDVVSAYIRRIGEVQPIINAVVENRFEEALKDAEEVDRLVASGTMSPSQMSKEKPLLGLPFTSKNSIAIKGMRQDAGSLFWHGRRAEEDAPSVALLKAAGAIPLALTNVPELCMWGDSQNLIDGHTRNPHDTRRSAGGSSGGEGSLLAAGGSLIGLGTDIGGSVRIPAAFCGICSHKPTAGVVPNSGLLPDAGENLGQFNCVGPMTRFAEDLPLVLNVLAGSATIGLGLSEKKAIVLLQLSLQDTGSKAFKERKRCTEGRNCGLGARDGITCKVNLNMLKVYYMETEGSLYISRTTNDARRAVRQAVQFLKEAHGLQAHPLQLPEMRFGIFLWFQVAGALEPRPLAEMFRPGGFNVLIELLRYLVGAGRHTLAALAASSMALLSCFSSKQQGEGYVASVENARDRFEETLGDDGVLVLPAATSIAPFRNQDLAMFDSPAMTALFSLFKVPVTVCPVMRSADNLPLGVQVVAKRGNDRLCIAVAREIEKRFGGWTDPSVKLQMRP